MIKIIVKGEPVAQARPRFTTVNGYARAYNTNSVVMHKKLIQDEAIGKVDELLETPLYLQINVYRRIPKSYSKKKREQALNRKLLPTQKPDVDNYAKLIKDALNGVIWKDDSQVVCLNICKWFSDEPRTEIEIWEVGYG